MRIDIINEGRGLCIVLGFFNTPHCSYFYRTSQRRMKPASTHVLETDMTLQGRLGFELELVFQIKDYFRSQRTFAMLVTLYGMVNILLSGYLHEQRQC